MVNHTNIFISRKQKQKEGKGGNRIHCIFVVHGLRKPVVAPCDPNKELKNEDIIINIYIYENISYVAKAFKREGGKGRGGHCWRRGAGQEENRKGRALRLSMTRGAFINVLNANNTMLEKDSGTFDKRRSRTEMERIIDIIQIGFDMGLAAICRRRPGARACRGSPTTVTSFQVSGGITKLSWVLVI